MLQVFFRLFLCEFYVILRILHRFIWAVMLLGSSGGDNKWWASYGNAPGGRQPEMGKARLMEGNCPLGEGRATIGTGAAYV